MLAELPNDARGYGLGVHSLTLKVRSQSHCPRQLVTLNSLRWDKLKKTNIYANSIDKLNTREHIHTLLQCVVTRFKIVLIEILRQCWHCPRFSRTEKTRVLVSPAFENTMMMVFVYWFIVAAT